MKINYIPLGQSNIAEIISDQIIITTQEEAFDIMINCIYQDADRLLLYEENISPLFFDLKTKLAGDILQKFSTYKAGLAIVGDFEKYESKSLRDFIFESNKNKQVLFLKSREEVLQAWGATAP